MARPRKTSPDNETDDGAEAATFEASFKRLSEMAEQLEAGGLTLAEATARFEEGMKLVQYCNQLLSNAELKITELKQTYSDEEARFDLDDLEEDPDD